MRSTLFALALLAGCIAPARADRPADDGAAPASGSAADTATAGDANADSPSTPAPPESAMARIHDLTMTRLDGSPLPSEQLDGKALLLVNVASQCGYTPQYKGLQALSEARSDVLVVGVPCNQFGGQEPGSAEQIATFCERNYGVTFPILEKQKVNGPERSALYQALVGSEAGGGADIRWNFEKFVVDKAGVVTARFASGTTPDSAELTAALDAAVK